MNIYSINSSTQKLTITTRDECLDSLNIISIVNGISFRKYRRSKSIAFVFKLFFIVYNYGHLIKNIYGLELNIENMRKVFYVK